MVARSVFSWLCLFNLFCVQSALHTNIRYVIRLDSFFLDWQEVCAYKPLV